MKTKLLRRLRREALEKYRVMYCHVDKKYFVEEYLFHFNHRPLYERIYQTSYELVAIDTAKLHSANHLEKRIRKLKLEKVKPIQIYPKK